MQVNTTYRVTKSKTGMTHQITAPRVDLDPNFGQGAVDISRSDDIGIKHGLSLAQPWFCIGMFPVVPYDCNCMHLLHP